MIAFMICIVYQILFGWHNQLAWDGWVL